MSKQFTILAILSMALMTGCSEAGKNTKSANPLSTTQANQLAAEGKSSEASEMYARISEILLVKPQGIIHAQVMLDKALELNSSNNKANIYSAMISPMMKAQGFVPRFKAIANQHPNLKLKLKELESGAYNSQVEEFIKFATQMPEGKMAAKSYEDVRKFLRNEYVKELRNSLDKLERVKGDTILSLDLSSSRTEKFDHTTIESSAQIDQIIQIEARKEKIEKKIKLDSYDLKALKILVKTQKNALLIASSIGLQGLEELGAKASKGLLKTDEQVVNAISANSEFLKIDGSKEDLKEIFDHSEEVMNDLIDFSRISEELCSNSSRKDNMASNLCVSDAAAQKIEEVLTFVVGPKTVLLGLDQNGEEVVVEVDLRALLNSKFSSLQELLPNKFDSSGKALNVKDKTFKGIIPNGDLIEKMKTVIK